MMVQMFIDEGDADDEGRPRTSKRFEFTTKGDINPTVRSPVSWTAPLKNSSGSATRRPCCPPRRTRFRQP